MLPYESKSSFSTHRKQTMTMSIKEEGEISPEMEVDVKLEFNEEEEEDEFLNEPDESANGSDVEPDQVEFNYELEDEEEPWVDEMDPLSINVNQNPLGSAHNRNRFEKTKFYCEECSYKSSRKADLQRHINSQHSQFRRFSCPEMIKCEYVGLEGTSMKNHLTNVHKKSSEEAKAIWTVLFAPTPFLTDPAVEIVNPKPASKPEPENIPEQQQQQSSKSTRKKCCTIFFHCDHCDFYTNEDKQLAIHLFGEHNLPRVILKKLPTGRRTTSSHMKDKETHSTANETSSLVIQPSIQISNKDGEIIRLFNCPEPNCTYSYPRKQSVQHHLFSKHGKRGAFKIYRCTFCSHESPRHHQLKKHVDSLHRQIKNFTCHLCTFKTNVNARLKLHINETHLQIKKFTCGRCSFKTARKGDLQRHQKRLHLEDGQFKCPEIGCDYSTITARQLKTHIGKQHMKSKYHANKIVKNLALLETSSSSFGSTPSASSSVIVKEEEEEEFKFEPDQL